MKSQLVSTVVLVIVTLILVLYELMGIHSARRKGLTKNRSRFITHMLMLVLLVVLLVQIVNFGVGMFNE